jgi:CarD family transcriptional regulator
MFKLHDHVIYPAHGVAIVSEISEKMIAGTGIQFLKLNFLFKDMMILVPTYNIATIGIRYPSSEQEVNTGLYELSKKPEKILDSIDFTPSGWNRRHKEYQNKIQAGKLLEVAKIYRDLMYIAQQKDLSFGERTVLLATEELLVQEIQVVKNKDRDVVTQLLRNPFKQFIFHDKSFLQIEAHQQAT